MKKMLLLCIVIILSINTVACDTVSFDNYMNSNIIERKETSATTKENNPTSTPSAFAPEPENTTTGTTPEKTLIKDQDNVNKPYDDVVTPVNLVKVTVSRHIDGDTIWVKDELGKEYKLRMTGVNSPESTTKVEVYGIESSKFTEEYLRGKTIYLEKDVSETDKYGRLLRYIWMEPPTEINETEIRNKMFNAILVLEGYAQAASYPPDIKYAEYFKNFTSEARQNNKGLWSKELTNSINEQPIKVDSSTQVNQDTSKNAEVLYVGSKESNKYHNPDCKWAQKISQSNLITFASKAEAETKKYNPCNVCKP